MGAQVAVTMRRATHVRSAPFWHAVRLTAAGLAGTVLFRVTNPEDGFWIPEAALFIMRPDSQLTRRRAVLRVIGSVAGAALTTLVLVALRPDTTLLAVLAVVASGIAFSVQRVNFGLYITFVTCIFVLLTAFGGLPARTAISQPRRGQPHRFSTRRRCAVALAHPAASGRAVAVLMAPDRCEQKVQTSTTWPVSGTPPVPS